MDGETLRCPRRDERFGAFRSPEKDEWHERDHHRVCSYCGSMHPDDFMAVAEAGAELGPTDKSYKVYVDLPHPAPSGIRIVGGRNFPPSENETGYELLTAKLFAELEASGEHYRAEQIGRYWIKRGPNGRTLHTKFYFQHLSESQKRAFVDLLNAKKLRLGYPGHFYTTPFFIAYA